MATKLRVVDVIEIPERDDVLAIVDVVTGYLFGGCDDYVKKGSSDIWRITSIGTYPPTTTKRFPLALKAMNGDGSLTVGDVLECVESD